jgi:DNA-binding LacI/PurR family transcriptional regulator
MSAGRRTQERMAITLKDVALVAKVTPTVVSHVLHNKASTVRVSPATAERVRVAAEELGYRVNVMARNFRERQTKAIGVLNGRGLMKPTLAKGPRYFASLLDGVVQGAFLHGYSVTLCPLLLGEHPEDGLSDGRFDGLIWYSIDASKEILAALSKCAVPLVIVHAHASAFGNRYPTLICDNDHGLGLAIDHLAELGHRNIGFAIEGDAMNVESLERLSGFKRHMQRLGLPWGGDNVVDIREDRKELRAYLSSELRHSALIVHADGLASETIRMAQEYGHNIPEDLSIIGFDSTDFCEETRPSLTSISQPLFHIGERAAEQLIQLLAGGSCDPLELLLPCGLDIRGSTTSPASEETKCNHAQG